MAVKKEKIKKSARKTEIKGQKHKTEAFKRQVEIELIRSLIGCPKRQHEVVKGLGLRKLHSKVIRKNSPEIWGMVNKVQHLLKVEVLEKK